LKYLEHLKHLRHPEDRKAPVSANAHPPGQSRTNPLPLGLRIAPAESCPPEPFDPEIGRILYDGPQGRWIHHALRGDLVYQPRDEAPEVVEQRVPWSIRISSDGRLAAYSVGSLPDPELFLCEQAQGCSRIGIGVHATFHPDGLLIYSQPAGTRYAGSLTTVARAELRAHDLETGESWELTATPGVAEMEPAVSPEGDRLAFSDWRTGTAYLVTIQGRGVR
jgi:hypothetical protein